MKKTCTRNAADFLLTLLFLELQTPHWLLRCDATISYFLVKDLLILTSTTNRVCIIVKDSAKTLSQGPSTLKTHKTLCFSGLLLTGDATISYFLVKGLLILTSSTVQTIVV